MYTTKVKVGNCPTVSHFKERYRIPVVGNRLSNKLQILRKEVKLNGRNRFK